MTKLDTIAEADDARAQFDKFRADEKATEARSAAIKLVKSRIFSKYQVPTGVTGITKEEGKIVWGDGNSRGGGEATVTGRGMSMDMYNKGNNFVDAPLKDALTLLGIKVVPVAEKSLFGSSEVASVSLQQLADIDKPVAPAPAPVTDKPVDPGVDPSAARMAELDKLRDQLLATLKKGGQDPSPPNTTVVVPPKTNTDTSTSDKLKMGGSIAAGALSGQQLAKASGFGPIGQGVAGVTGGAIGGLARQAMKNENAIIYQSSIAQSLTESFGYDYEGQLGEYSFDQFKTDAGDTLRGAANGVTLGTYDNIAAGVGSAFGKDTYKQHLAAQTAASKEAEKRNPLLYTAGNIAGSLAVPIPGAAAGRLAMTGAKALGATGKFAQGAANLVGIGGANYLAQKAVDTVKSKADTATLGYDPSKYPTTPQTVMAFQKANGLAADGKIGPKTQAVLAKMGLTPQTAAEGIQSLRDKLAMIESQPQTQVIRVWLTPGNLVFTDDGEQITDHALLENIQWPAELLAEKDLKTTALGYGVGELEKLGGRFFGSGEKAGNKVAGKEFVRNPATNQMVKNNNFARAELPGAPKVALDPNTGTVGQKVAQGRADAAFEKGRADSAALQNTMRDFTGGGVASRAAAEAEAAKQAALKARLASGNGITKQTTGIGALAGKEAGLAGKEAGVAGKELTAAEKAAAAAEAKAASETGGLKAWAKANPKKAIALGLGALAGVTALGIAASGSDDPPPPPPPPPHRDPNQDPSPPNTTTGGELTAEQQAIIAQMLKIMSGYRDTEDPDLLSHITPADAAIQQANQSVGGKSKEKPVYKGAEDGPGIAPKPEQLAQTESTDAELSRWLKIARGQ
jgi:hypothetical protein